MGRGRRNSRRQLGGIKRIKLLRDIIAARHQDESDSSDDNIPLNRVVRDNLPLEIIPPSDSSSDSDSSIDDVPLASRKRARRLLNAANVVSPVRSPVRPVYFNDWENDEMDDLMATVDLDELMPTVEGVESAVPLSCTDSGLPLAPPESDVDDLWNDCDLDEAAVNDLMVDMERLGHDNMGNTDATAQQNTLVF